MFYSKYYVNSFNLYYYRQCLKICQTHSQVYFIVNNYKNDINVSHLKQNITYTTEIYYRIIIEITKFPLGFSYLFRVGTLVCLCTLFMLVGITLAYIPIRLSTCCSKNTRYNYETINNLFFSAFTLLLSFDQRVIQVPYYCNKKIVVVSTYKLMFCAYTQYSSILIIMLKNVFIFIFF